MLQIFPCFWLKISSILLSLFLFESSIACNTQPINPILNGDFLDTVPPTILTVEATDNDLVEIAFNKPLDENSALTISNYAIVSDNGSLAITGVRLENKTRIYLTTAVQEAQQEYILTVKNLTGRGNNPIPKQGYQNTFSGYGILPDPTAPAVIYPEDGTQTGYDIQMIWEAKSGANTYTIQISQDSAFSTILVDTTLPALKTSYSLTVSQSVTHYWRVFADVTEEAVPIHWFEPLSAIYVWGDSPQTEEKGTKNKPYKTIQAGINAGAELGLDVYVAQVDDAYHESIGMIEDVDVYGGYNALDQWETQDYESFQTIIDSSKSLGITIANLYAPTILQGFTILGSDEGTTVGIKIFNSSSAVTVEHNRILAGDCTGDCYGIYCSEEGNVTIRNNEIQGGNCNSTDGTSTAVYILRSDPLIEYNNITGGDLTSSEFRTIALHVKENASPSIQFNTILGGTIHTVTSTSSESYAILFEETDQIQCSNNTIIGGDNDEGYSSGIALLDAEDITIEENTIQNGSTNTMPSYAISNRDYSDMVLINNQIQGVEQTNKASTLVFNESSAAYIAENTMIASKEAESVTIVDIVTTIGNFIMEKNELIFGGGHVTANMVLIGIGLSQIIVRKNIMYGSSFECNNMYGFYIFNSTAFFSNNLFVIPDNIATSWVTGGYIGSTTQVNLVNNTVIVGESPDAAYCVGLIIAATPGNQADSKIVNNIFATKGVGDPCYGILELGPPGGTSCNPLELYNNLLFHLNPGANTWLYKNNNQTNIDDNSPDEEIDTELVGVGADVSGNITYPTTDQQSDFLSIFSDPEDSNSDPWDDFLPISGNRALDKGMNVYDLTDYDSITDDIVEQPRPSVGAWDIGAYHAE